ncbi:hypothetical protein FB451DRAFT_193209 [Mycena latifolia]|nr:hypothetical protein FB451DRAFT_193209 [Mycena latifolia]
MSAPIFSAKINGSGTQQLSRSCASSNLKLHRVIVERSNAGSSAWRGRLDIQGQKSRDSDGRVVREAVASRRGERRNEESVCDCLSSRMMLMPALIRSSSFHRTPPAEMKDRDRWDPLLVDDLPLCHGDPHLPPDTQPPARGRREIGKPRLNGARGHPVRRTDSARRAHGGKFGLTGRRSDCIAYKGHR